MSFDLRYSRGVVVVHEDMDVVWGLAHVSTMEMTRHTVFTPRTIAELEKALDVIRALGETPYMVEMATADYQHLKSQTQIPVFSRGYSIVPKVCECGATKTKLPFHSDWCPIK